MTAPVSLSQDHLLGQLRLLVGKVVAEEDRAMVDIDTITSETHLLSLPLDSLATMELMTAIEDTFKVYVPESKAFEFITVGDVISYVQTKLASKVTAKQTPTNHP